MCQSYPSIWVRLSPKLGNLGLFTINFKNSTQNWSSKVPDQSHLCPAWPNWGQSLTLCPKLTGGGEWDKRRDVVTVRFSNSAVALDRLISRQWAWRHAVVGVAEARTEHVVADVSSRVDVAGAAQGHGLVLRDEVVAKEHHCRVDGDPWQGDLTFWKSHGKVKIASG